MNRRRGGWDNPLPVLRNVLLAANTVLAIGLSPVIVKELGDVLEGRKTVTQVPARVPFVRTCSVDMGGNVVDVPCEFEGQ